MAHDLTGQSGRFSVRVASSLSNQCPSLFYPPILEDHRPSSQISTNVERYGHWFLPVYVRDFEGRKSVASESENAETGLLGALRRLLANVNGI